MKKLFDGITLKESKDKFDKFYETLSDADKNNEGSVEINANKSRTKSQNNLIHAMITEIANFTGETNVSRMKNIIKQQLGYYKVSEVEMDDCIVTTKVYEKTSEFNTKELAEFVTKLEGWAATELNYVFAATMDKKSFKDFKNREY